MVDEWWKLVFVVWWFVIVVGVDFVRSVLKVDVDYWDNLYKWFECYCLCWLFGSGILLVVVGECWVGVVGLGLVNGVYGRKRVGNLWSGLFLVWLYVVG